MPRKNDGIEIPIKTDNVINLSVIPNCRDADNAPATTPKIEQRTKETPAKTSVAPDPRAKERGLKPLWTVNHGWISGMYYRDPDNNLVEIFFEHFSSENEFKENISPDFEDEPIGTNMDIEILYDM